MVDSNNNNNNSLSLYRIFIFIIEELLYVVWFFWGIYDVLRFLRV